MRSKIEVACAVEHRARHIEGCLGADADVVHAGTLAARTLPHYLAAMADYQPRYNWRSTGLGMPQDFCWYVDGRTVALIYLTNSFREESWYWSMFAQYQH